MKNLNHRLLYVLILLFIAVGTLTNAFAQITPSQDSYTNTASATTNFGAAPTLGVATVSNSIQTTFIQFDLSSIPPGYTSSNIAKATLKLYINSVTTAGSFNLDLVNGSWKEKTITDNLSPALGSTIASSVPLATASANNYLAIDVTSAVGAWLNGSEPNDGLALVANSGLSATFDSKENSTQSHPAELDIVYASQGTITGVTTASGSGLIGGGTSGTLKLSLLKTCSANQVLQWNGSAWVCGTISGSGTITGVKAGTDLIGGGNNGTVTLNLDTTKVPQLNAVNTFTVAQLFNGNGRVMTVGDPGCGAGFAGFGFGGLVACSNYALIGDGTNIYLNRTTGGAMHFREGNGDEMTIAPGGAVSVTLLGTSSAPALTATSKVETIDAIQAFGGGGDGEGLTGGRGILAIGGTETNTDNMAGGDGIDAVGGTGLQGGVAVSARGGDSTNTSGGDALDAYAGNGVGATGYSGFFQNGDVNILGNLGVLGTISAGTKDFRIDHPLDPANKYLYHASVESSEMMNIYTGNVILDGSGAAAIQLPSWFEAVNTDCRYELTAIGAAAPNLHVAQEVANHQFSIAGGAPGMKVSWQVTGVRHDAFAKANPLMVEVDKPANERGFYLHPDLYGKPDEKQVEWGKFPAKMRRLKELHSQVMHQTVKK